MPVDGPPRCTLMMVTGISAKVGQADELGHQRDARARGGGEGARAVPAAPTTMPMEASSSSACTMA
jgi:hypothetical protein